MCWGGGGGGGETSLVYDQTYPLNEMRKRDKTQKYNRNMLITFHTNDMKCLLNTLIAQLQVISQNDYARHHQLIHYDK